MYEGMHLVIFFGDIGNSVVRCVCDESRTSADDWMQYHVYINGVVELNESHGQLDHHFMK